MFVAGLIDVKVSSPKETFGVNSHNTPLIDLDRAAQASGVGFDHDVVLHKCYRNTREILVTAHALGFGIYSDHIVQMLEDKDHWEDVGYIVEDGDCTAGHDVVIHRPEDNSPLSLSQNQTPQQLVQIYCAKSYDDEINWIIKGIREFLDEGLKPEDLLVIALDDRNARNYFVRISVELSEIDIRTNNVLTNPYDYTTFFEEGAVTLSTVYRAKGNEASVVFAVGVESLAPLRNHQRTRNKIFTAFTRAKAWLRISGLSEADVFADEIDSALANFPKLRFTYPDVDQIHLIQRDLKDKTESLRRLSRQLKKEVEELGLDPEEQLELLLGGKEKK